MVFERVLTRLFLCVIWCSVSLVQEMACTCLFLAGKVEERRVRVDHVLGAYYQDRELEEKKWATAQKEDFAPRPKPLLDSAEWNALRNRVYECEAILLDAIEYNFDILHPYSYLRKFLEKYIYSNTYCKESQEQNKAKQNKTRSSAKGWSVDLSVPTLTASFVSLFSFFFFRREVHCSSSWRCRWSRPNCMELHQ